MFPDTANFTDPTYTGGDPMDPVDLTGTNDPRIFLPQTGDLRLEPTMYDPGNTLTPPTTGGAASNSSVQSHSTGSSLLGWLGLANNVANTVANSTRSGYTTRPGVNQKPSASMGSFGTVTTTTLIVIVAVFVGVLFMLKRR